MTFWLSSVLKSSSYLLSLFIFLILHRYNILNFPWRLPNHDVSTNVFCCRVIRSHEGANYPICKVFRPSLWRRVGRWDEVDSYCISFITFAVMSFFPSLFPCSPSFGEWILKIVGDGDRESSYESRDLYDGTAPTSLVCTFELIDYSLFASVESDSVCPRIHSTLSFFSSLISHYQTKIVHYFLTISSSCFPPL